MSHKAIRDVVAYLHTQFRAALDQSIAVTIGVPPGGDVPDAYVAVAYGGDDRAGITGVEIVDEGQNTGEFEGQDATIWCTISTASGDQDALAQMDATQDIFEECADILRADARFGGLLKGESTSSVGTYEWVIEDGGQVATLFFAVLVKARWLQ